MIETFFTSDTHFHHNNILEFCPNSRLGSDVLEMNEIMIQNWNARVKPHDIVWHTGDFAFAGKDKVIETILRLNGNINLVKGNHDNHLDTEEIRPMFSSFQEYKLLRLNGKKFVLFHFPIESWDQKIRGSYHLHGHLHGDSHHSCIRIKNRMDIGVDCRTQRDMTPFHFDEVMEYLNDSENE